MKYLLFFLVSVLQIYGQHPGRNVESLLNKTLKVKPLESNFIDAGYSNFYLKENFKKSLNDIYQPTEYYKSEYKSLTGKLFKVLMVIPYTNQYGYDKFKIKIQNETTGILYYDYDQFSAVSYPFITIDDSLPSDYHCKNIYSKVDKFTGNINFESNSYDGLKLFKTVSKASKDITLFASTKGNTPLVGESGVILLLENNKKIEKPNAKINVSVCKGIENYTYCYNSFIHLTAKDIELLLKYKITDVRLYIFDRSIDNGDLIKEYLKCLTK